MVAPEGRRAAYYAATGSGWRQWWTLLHPPYTAWHLSYVVLGACLAPEVLLPRLAWTLVAFFLAVGVAAHALDELHGRPLRTGIASPALVVASAVSLAGSAMIGALLVAAAGPALLPFLLAGPVLVVAYNAELFGGLLHNDAGFALSWGAFPVLAAYVAESGTLRMPAVLAAGAAGAFSVAQRRLSTPARLIRRRVANAEVRLALEDGSSRHLGAEQLLAPLEAALRATSWAMVLLACGLAVLRLG